MNSNEIKKALECCGKNPPICNVCGYRGRCNRIDCYDYLKRDALDLINRQKAEIERLKGWENLLKAEKHSLIKAETYKEFAEKINRVIDIHLERYSVAEFDELMAISQALRNLQNNIDGIVKEMVGDE